MRLHVPDPAGAAACRGENGRGGPARRYAPHRLLHRHTRHAGQRAGFALPDRRRGGERFGRRSGHLRGRPDEHGERPRAGACARTHVAAPQAVVHGAGQPRNDVVRKRLHDIPPSVRTCGMRRHPRQGLSLSGLCQRALYENGRRNDTGRRPRMARTPSGRRTARRADRKPLPLSAQRGSDEPAGGDRDAEKRGRHGIAVRPLPPAAAAQLRRDCGDSGPRARGQKGRSAGVYAARLFRRLGAHTREAARHCPRSPGIRSA